MAGSRKGLKIFAAVTGILLIVILVVLVVLVVLFVTILKPKEPSIFTKPVTLESFELVVTPVVRLNVSIGILITVKNPNYGGFKYENSTAHISYRGNVVAEAPIEKDTIPARATHNITSSVSILADKLVTDTHFLGDVILVGVLNFTSETTLHGKVSLLKVFEMKATSYSECNISITIKTQSADSVCKSKVELKK
ncbi:hypothetical protein PRUPE_4G024900 [Prunus persica]|uniref:Late embryogenesis abundant protein LEA-2 subgroup domain-containing protein n=1 Tax=Prunus persica TaxID=3760 RepID=M5WIM1_PRUPE|nr:late embryogenesis abundant protein At1g64065 [Prunus persica]ONI10051.1 hypothetical protein PRUPE_4G024900 [Prunus persica]